MATLSNVSLGLVAVVVVCSCGAARDGTAPRPPDDAAADHPVDEAPDLAPAGEEQEQAQVSSEPTADAQHITFDAEEAAAVPAEGVVAQPQREPLPSMMGDVLYGPSK
jgi:hypothetical protein